MLGDCSYQLQGLFEDVLHTVKLLNVQFTLVDFFRGTIPKYHRCICRRNQIRVYINMTLDPYGKFK